MRVKYRNRINLVQKQFALLIFITAAVNGLIFYCCIPTQTKPPKYVLQKTFMTMDCSDGRRLGNLMFNYASLIGITHRYNTTPVVMRDFRLFDIFNITAAKSSNMQNTLGSYTDYVEYGRRACAFDVGVKHLKRESVFFHGYFQSWRYFENATHLVRSQFTFNDVILNEAKLIHYKAGIDKSKNTIVVGIHIRRGDLLEQKYSNYGYITADKSYFDLAMNYFRNKYKHIIFIVCTNDKDWSQENILGDNVIISHASSDAVDLAVLSLCDHVIVSVGSFGWWGAWLANGTTVYYSKWPSATSMLEYMVTKRDYFYSHWIPLP